MKSKTITNLSYSFKIYSIFFTKKIVKFNVLLFLTFSSVITNSQNLTTNDYLNLVKSKAPQTPTGASFEKYSFYPISPSNGTIDISVPIYTIRRGDLEIPISINYHTGGIKVEEKATNVGLGWLLKAGGMITRVKNGGIDEDPVIGYLAKSSDLPAFGDPNLTYPSRDFFYKIKNTISSGQRQYDLEPDLYTFNFLGMNGSFYFSKSGKVLSDANIPIRIEFDRFNSTFKITDAKGNIYFFETKQEVSTDFSSSFVTGSAISYFQVGKNHDGTYQGSFLQCPLGWYYNLSNDNILSPRNENFYVNGWLLTKVLASNNVDSIIFNYNYEPYFTGNFRTSQVLNYFYQSSCNNIDNIKNVNVIENYSNITGNEPQLSSINFSGGRIEVGYISDRKDKYTSKDRISGIKVINQANEIVSSIVFNNNDYFVSADGTDFRLRLNGVSINNPLSNEVNYQYHFKYHDNSLPSVNSNSQDFWGYHNGKQNSTLIPKVYYYDGINPVVSLGTADRSANQESMKAFALSSIVYPSGGMTRFFYSGHKADLLNKSIVVGGLKIDKQLLYPDANDLSNFVEKRFDYSYQNKSGVGRLLTNSSSELNFSLSRDYYHDLGVENRYLHLNSSPLTLKQLPGVSNVEYDEVIEKDYGSNGCYNGKKVYRFSLSADPLKYTSKNFDFSTLAFGKLMDASNVSKNLFDEIDNFKNKGFYYHPSAHPKMITEELYDNTNKKLQSKVLEYTSYLKPYDSIIGLNVAPFTNYYHNKEVIHNDPDYQPYQFQYFLYYIPIGYNLLAKETVTQYSNGKEMSEIKNYSYDNEYSLIKSISSFTSKGEQSSIEYKYPFDFDSIGNNRNLLLFKNILNPFQVLKFSNNKLVEGNGFIYDDYGNLKQLFKNDTSLYAFRMDKIIPDNFSFFLNMKFNSGRLVEFYGRDLVKTSYLWGYKNNYVVAKIQGVEFDQVNTLINKDILDNPNSSDEIVNEISKIRYNPIAKNSLIQTYTYKDIIGLETARDFNNIYSTYKYDPLGRLNLILDNDNNVQKRIDFKYKNINSINIVNNSSFYNDAVQKTFTRNNCPTNYVGDFVTYAISKGTYISYLSKEDANNQANSDINANGQNFANSICNCSPSKVSINLNGNLQPTTPSYRLIGNIKNIGSGETFSIDCINSSNQCSVLAYSGTYMLTVYADQYLPPSFRFDVIVDGAIYSGGREAAGTSLSLNFNVVAGQPKQIKFVCENNID